MVERTSIALNTWSASATQLWNNAVALAKATHHQWTMMAPSQSAACCRLVYARLDMLNLLNSPSWKLSCIQICATTVCLTRSNPWLHKGANTVTDLLSSPFSLPSEPSARVEGLATAEAPAKPAGEALSFLRSWRQQVLTVVIGLRGNPEPLKLLSTLRTLLSSLFAPDTAFAMEVSQIYKQTPVRRFAMMSLDSPLSIYLR